MEAVAALFATTAVAAAEGTAFLAPLVTTVTTEAAATTLGVLQGVMSAGQALASFGSGAAGLMQGITQGQLSDIEAGQIRLASEQRSLEIKRAHLKSVADNRVAFAASGVDIASGTPGAIEDDLAHQATFQTGIEARNAVLREIAARRRGDMAEVRGYADLATGVGKGRGAIGDYGLSIARRG